MIRKHIFLPDDYLYAFLKSVFKKRVSVGENIQKPHQYLSLVLFPVFALDREHLKFLKDIPDPLCFKMAWEMNLRKGLVEKMESKFYIILCP